jgi:hypothetical protein
LGGCAASMTSRTKIRDVTQGFVHLADRDSGSVIGQPKSCQSKSRRIFTDTSTVTVRCLCK